MQRHILILMSRDQHYMFEVPGVVRGVWVGRVGVGGGLTGTQERWLCAGLTNDDDGNFGDVGRRVSWDWLWFRGSRRPWLAVAKPPPPHLRLPQALQSPNA